MLGPADAVLSGFTDLRAAFHPIGLEIQDSKCEIFSTITKDISTDFSIPVSTDGTVILGTPIDKPSFIPNACIEAARSGSHLCDQLPLLEDT